MTNVSLPDKDIQPHSWLRGWFSALAITFLGILLGGLGCFVLLGNYLLSLVQTQQLDLFQAAVWWQVGFTVAMAVILGVIIVWQRARGSGLTELGWGRPTNALALVLAVLLGAAFLTGNYFGAQRLLPGVNVTEFNWTRVALAPVGIFLAAAEEIMMRGFFMTQLQKARVPTWLQIMASRSVFCLLPRGLQNPSLLGFLPSFILFSMHAGLYVLGKRSLTPVVVTHSMYHVFGEPYLLMLAMVAMKH